MISRKITTITRTFVPGGPLANLDINDESTYFMLEDGFAPGGVTWRRTEVESQYTDGSYEVGAVKEDSHASYGVAVKRTTQAALHTAVAAIVAAFAQRTFTLNVSIDAVVTSYSCKRANWEISWAGNWIDDSFEPIAVIAFTFDRRALQTAGSL
jgi:hypothetical protein